VIIVVKIIETNLVGKSYDYKPNPYSKESLAFRIEEKFRATKNVDRRLPLQKITSIMRKLNNQLAKEMAENKIKKERKRTRGLETV